jgi:hypothetical protein
VTRPRWTILVVFAAWTLLVWATRIDNIWADDTLSDGGKVTRSLLALSFVAAGVAVGVVAARTFRRPPAPIDRGLVAVAAAWTVGVWVVRSAGIAFADHDGAFIAVHLLLGVISSGLALGSVWAVRSGTSPADREVGVATG